jgi:uncharacterized coiled-coil protein SlyX
MADQPPQGINFKKIVENVLSYLVTGVFVGACVIVWRGATTVDERVGKTEANMKVLIDNLSAKLSSYESQMESQSNQLAAVYNELKKLRPADQPVAAKPIAEREWMQKARQQDIQQQLLKK